jgi:hypothetical protein
MFTVFPVTVYGCDSPKVTQSDLISLTIPKKFRFWTRLPSFRNSFICLRSDIFTFP